ncbi:MAG: hypothetical protein LBH43_17970 [Treponema sp.]|jgi:hypothetical protein|nr:hypothetical protein [Treponema sp.]
MASKNAVDTAFTATDKISPAMAAASTNTNRFSLAAKAAFRSIIPETSRLGGALNDITKGVVIGNLITKGVTTAAGIVKNTVMSIPEFANRADEIGKTAQKLGLTTDALQRYRYAASKANVESSTLNTAFEKMSKGLGSGALFTSLEKIDAGLASQVRGAKSVDEAFRMITDAASIYSDVTQRTALLTTAFGKAGNQLVPMIGNYKDKVKSALESLNKEQLNIAVNATFRGMETGALFDKIGKFDQDLAIKVKGAGDAKQAFLMITEAAAKMGDANKRNEFLMSALGETGEKLSPMLGGLAEQMEAAGKFGNIISPQSIETATRFNGAMTDVKSMLQSFGDIVRGAVVQYVVPLIEKIKEWTGANREMIATKINTFISDFANTVKMILPYAVSFVSTAIKFAPVILTAVAAIKAFSIAKGVYQGVSIAVQAYNTMLAAKAAATAAATTATTAQTAAQTGLNAAMKANIFGIVIALVIVAVAAFMQLAQKVGGVKNAFIVVRQTIMKAVLTPINLVLDGFQLLAITGARIGVILSESFKVAGQTIMMIMLTPINLVIDGIKNILTLVSKLPGKAGNFAKDALKAAGSFQDKMNVAMTGTTATISNTGLGAVLDPAKNAKETMADKMKAAESSAMANTAGVKAFQDKMNITLTGSASTLTNSGIGFVTEPYKNARSAELARQEAAKESVKDEEPMKETNDLLHDMLEKMDDQIDATESLGKGGSGSSPANLRWGKMGEEDFFEIQRLGI